MKSWSLPALLADVHDDIAARLSSARRLLMHTTTMGDASENAWRDLFALYLPQRYRSETAHVVDSKNQFSEQLDIVVFDRQYTPPIFTRGGQFIIPAESVYAVFECKQTMSATEVKYAQEKIESVRRLHRTSLPVPNVTGVTAPRPLSRILGGLLTLESEWSPALGAPLERAIQNAADDGRLDLGCVANHGFFSCNPVDSCVTYPLHSKPVVGFLFELIAQLQACATVPMIDPRAYSAWLLQDPT